MKKSSQLSILAIILIIGFFLAGLFITIGTSGITKLTLPGAISEGSASHAEEAGNQVWRGLLYSPESNSEEFLNEFESLVTEALVPAGINLIMFNIWDNYHFTSFPELARLERPEARNFNSRDAKKMADICRENGIHVMVQMGFLTHQKYNQLLKAFPQFQWPGDETLWNPLNPEVNEVAFKMADELIDAFGAEGFNVAMDEGWGFDVTKLPENEQHYTAAEIYAKAINEYYQHFVNEKGVEMLMWSDMLEGRYKDAPVEEALTMIPKDIILLSWDYECHWRYPLIGKWVGKVIPVCPWDNDWPTKLQDMGFRVMVSPWENPLAAKALIESAAATKNINLRGVLYTTWSSKINDELKDALLAKNSSRKLDPTIVGISKTIKKTIGAFITTGEKPTTNPGDFVRDIP
jgi:hypothetical protein